MSVTMSFLEELEKDVSRSMSVLIVVKCSPSRWLLTQTELNA